MMERKFTDDEKILSLLKMSDDLYANAKLTPEEAKTLLDLINRQKAELESLKEAYAIYEETTGLKWARAEAIKEFAERLKSRASGVRVGWHEFVTVEGIDNLVKEMTGEDNGN